MQRQFSVKQNCVPPFVAPRGRRVPRLAQLVIRKSGCNSNGEELELPPELKDLKISESGLLIDEKTGEVINEYGATRFDIKLAALNGMFTPHPTMADTERSQGLILDSLVEWPSPYDFQFVLKMSTSDSATTPESIVEELRIIIENICQFPVPFDKCSYKLRKGGKFVSVCVTAIVRGPDIIQKVFEAVENDGRILMKY